MTKHWYHNSLKVLLSQAAAFRNKATKWKADVSLLSVHQQRALDFFCTPATERTLKYEPAAVHCLLNDVQSTKNCTFCAIQGLRWETLFCARAEVFSFIRLLHFKLTKNENYMLFWGIVCVSHVNGIVLLYHSCFVLYPRMLYCFV